MGQDSSKKKGVDRKDVEDPKNNINDDTPNPTIDSQVEQQAPNHRSRRNKERRNNKEKQAKEELDLPSPAPKTSMPQNPNESSAVTEFMATFFPTADVVMAVDRFEDLMGRLGLDLSTVAPFVFIFAARCAGCWEVTGEEMRTALDVLELRRTELTKADVKKAVEQQIKLLRTDDKLYAQFFQWAFGFCRENPAARSVAMPSIKEPLRVMLGIRPLKAYRCCPPVEFISFLEKNITVMSRDLFKQIPLFLLKTPAGFAGYDPDCWSSTIDAFVEERRSTGK